MWITNPPGKGHRMQFGDSTAHIRASWGIAVYEQIENFLGAMFYVVGDIKTGSKHHLFLEDEKTFSTLFLPEFMKVMKFTTWVSPEIRKILSKFNELVLDNSALIIAEKDKNVLVTNAVNQYEHVNQLKKELEVQLIDDYKNIYKRSIKRLKRPTK